MGVESKKPRYLIGLGNPGPEYELTRHNMGFLLVDRLTDRFDAAPKVSKTARLWKARGELKGRPVAAVKPLSFMNRSGQALMELHRAVPDFLSRSLFLYDDVSLEFGRMRFRPAGSAGGHNGVRDVIAAFGTDEFDRLKIGVGGARPARGDLSDYVLAPFGKAERDRLDELLDEAADAVEHWLEWGMTSAMNRHNGRSEGESDVKDGAER